MSITSIIDMVVSALATLTSFISAAEDIYVGNERGKEKKAWVIDQASKILAEHVHKFFGTNAGKAVLGALIDAIVLVANRSGNLSASPTSPAPSSAP